MLGDRHQLDVREPVRDHVVGERLRDLAVLRKAIGAVATPRAQVQLVDRHRRVERVARRTRCHPVGVAPRVVEVPDPRCGGRRRLGVPGERIRLVERRVSVARDDPVLVRLSGAYVVDAALPQSGTVVRAAGDDASFASQPFHSPITATREAFGAHTRNVAPSACNWHPRWSYSRA